MKIKHLCLLLIIPFVQLVLGLGEALLSQRVPQAEPAQHLRAYIGGLEAGKEKMNPEELGMLSTLQSTLDSLDYYYSVYNPLKNLQAVQAQGFWMLAVAQMLSILLYIRSLKKKSPH